MTLDPTTLLAMSSLAAIICGVSFILNTSFNSNDPAGRTWSLGFISGIVVAAGYGAGTAVPDAWWALLVGNVAYVVSIGALWSGTRLFNGRSSRLWVVGAIALVVGLITLFQITGEGVWAGSTSLCAGLVVLMVLAALELQRGRLRRNLNSRSFSLVLWIVAAFTSVRVVVYFSAGRESDVFHSFFSSGIASILTMTLVISAAITVSILRTEAGGASAVGDFSVGIHSRAGVLSAAAFTQAAGDHLERAAAAQAGIALIGADVDSLPEVNIAFGRTAGDDAISEFAQTLRFSAPVMALIGHPSAGRFLIVVAVAGSAEALAVTERIQTALVDNPLPENQKIRLTASFGIADSFDHGYSLENLTERVYESIDTVKASGGNHIEVAHS